MFCKNCGQEISADSTFCQNCGKGESVATTNPVKEETRIVSSKNKLKGVLWMIIPFISLFVILTAYAIISFITAMSTDGVDQVSDRSIAVTRLISVILGLLGIVAVIAIPVGFAIGLVYLTKKDYQLGKYDVRSGAGAKSEFPKELEGWNWGAAGLGWIWGACNNVWLSFIAFIPYVGLVWWIVMGIKGTEWAWRSAKWESVEAFKATQKKWRTWGLIFFFLPIAVFAIAMFVGIFFEAFRYSR